MAGRIKVALYQLLVDAAIVDGTRVYPAGETPADAPRPYLTYHRISNRHTHHQGGGSGMATARFQVDCWADSANEADTLYDATRDALDAYVGVVGMGENAVTIDSIVLETDADEPEGPVAASETRRHRTSLDFLITYRESVTAPA